MSREEGIENETLEIADLEYDVGGVCSAEPADSRVNVDAWVIMVVPK
jgi:hypothetical protein